MEQQKPQSAVEVVQKIYELGLIAENKVKSEEQEEADRENDRTNLWDFHTDYTIDVFTKKARAACANEDAARKFLAAQILDYFEQGNNANQSQFKFFMEMGALHFLDIEAVVGELMAESEERCIECMTSVFDNGYGIKLPSSWGSEIVYQSIINGNDNLAKFLLERGANPHIPSKNGKTILDRIKREIESETDEENKEASIKYFQPLIKLLEEYMAKTAPPTPGSTAPEPTGMS